VKRCSKRFRAAAGTPGDVQRRIAAARCFSESLPVGPGRILPDLLPENTSGLIVSRLLPSADWDRLRYSVGQAGGMRCMVCGQPNHDPLNGQPRHPECHQVWQFAADSTHAVQRLAALVALCIDCHRVQHLNAARMRGELPLALMQLRAVNAWTSTEIRQAVSDAERRYRWRKQYEWDLDLSLLVGQVRIPGYPGRSITSANRTALGIRYFDWC
jgi:hypothetical protein